MTQHSSLKASKTKKHRTVLKRYERFFKLKEKGILKDDNSVFGMPKLKITRVKIKKAEKAEKPEEAGVVGEATQAPAGTAPKDASAKSAAGKPAPAAGKPAAAKPAKEEKKEKK